MRIEQIGKTSATVVYKSDATILVSYNTPVAAYVLGRGYIRTNQFYSVTTSKHINQWLRDKIGNRNLTVESVDPEVLYELYN